MTGRTWERMHSVLLRMDDHEKRGDTKPGMWVTLSDAGLRDAMAMCSEVAQRLNLPVVFENNTATLGRQTLVFMVRQPARVPPWLESHPEPAPARDPAGKETRL
jgi:hypothetical protein